VQYECNCESSAEQSPPCSFYSHMQQIYQDSKVLCVAKPEAADDAARHVICTSVS
jgi:hypothetical protein